MASFYFVTTEVAKPHCKGKGHSLLQRDFNIINNAECDALDNALFGNLSPTQQHAISKAKAKQARASEALGHADVVCVMDRKRRAPQAASEPNKAVAPFAVVGDTMDAWAQANATLKKEMSQQPRRRSIRPQWAQGQKGGVLC
jgi:hypothetical protein